MDKMYVGQICDLYLNKSSEYADNAIPFDPFYDKYYYNLHPSDQKQNNKFLDTKTE